MSRVWQPERVVEAGGVNLGTLDMDVRVQKPKDDPLEFEVIVYNLADRTWSRIDDGDTVRIRLGWLEDDTQTVCVGTVDTRKRRTGSDVEHVIAGVDETEDVLSTLPDSGDRWRNADPATIASDIGRTVGLSPRVEQVGGSISGLWNVTTNRQWSDYLDDLVEHAEELSGREWEWYGERGQLVFTPREQGVVSVPEFSYDGVLRSIGPKSDVDDDVEGQLEFEALLDPRIRKGGIAAVEHESYSGAYRVSDYEFDSSTISGDHYVRGTLTPLDADYSIA